MAKETPRALLLERILEDFGFRSVERSWTFKEDVHNKVASIHAKDIYEIIKVLDWDELQHGKTEVVGKGRASKRKPDESEREGSEDELEEE